MEEFNDFDISVLSSSSSEDNYMKDLKVQISKIKNSKLKERIEKEAKKIKEKLKKEKDKKLKQLKEKVRKIKQKNEDPKYLVIVDKLTYCFVMISFIFTFGLLFYPSKNTTFTYIIIKALLLLSHRLYTWKKKKWHYYLFDYCYTVNIFMLFCFKFGYKNKYLLSMFFTNAFGPLASSFLIFRYTIIWHDLNAYTTFFIHICPALAAWIMRFHVTEEKSTLPNREEWEAWIQQESFFKIYFVGLSYYLIWGIVYYMLIFHILDQRIKRKGNMTLYQYAVESSDLFKLISTKFNKRKHLELNRLLYMSLHAVISLLSFFFSTFLIYHRWATFFVVVVMMVKPIWSTSTYYHEYFTQKYGEQIIKEAEENKINRLQKENESRSREGSAEYDGDR